MVLTAAQRAQIAAAYERAASDETLPRQARAAFVNKASWFRMLAQIETAKEVGGRSSGGKHLNRAVCTYDKLPRVPLNMRGQTLAERLSRAHPIGFLTPK